SGAAAVGSGQDLEQVPVRILEVQAAAAVAPVDLPALAAAGVGPVVDPAVADAAEDRVELLLADQERVVLRRDGLVRHVEVEGDVVVHAHDVEWPEACRPRAAEDLREERRRATLIAAPDDRMV